MAEAPCPQCKQWTSIDVPNCSGCGYTFKEDDTRRLAAVSMGFGRKRDREDLLKSIGEYLRREGIETTISELPSDYGRKGGSQALQVTGQPIESIWAIMEWVGEGSNKVWSVSFRVRLALVRPPSRELKNAVKARTDGVYERKGLLARLGFSGKLLDVRWVGGQLAESLNLDDDLSTMLREYYTVEGSDAMTPIDVMGAITVSLRGQSWVDIRAPEWLVDEDRYVPSAVPFPLYRSIAEHARRIGNALG